MKHQLEAHMDTQVSNEMLAYESEDIVAYVTIAGFLAMTVILLIVISL